MKDNPVAKYARRVNRSAVHPDRKKASKRIRGAKHKHDSI